MKSIEKKDLEFENLFIRQVTYLFILMVFVQLLESRIFDLFVFLYFVTILFFICFSLVIVGSLLF